MSGHSKWKNIMHKKEKTDAQRAKVFTKIGKEMAIAVKEGGPDPVSNSKLASLITKAKSLNVPNDNIKRVIDRQAPQMRLTTRRSHTRATVPQVSRSSCRRPPTRATVLPVTCATILTSLAATWVPAAASRLCLRIRVSSSSKRKM